MSSFVMDKLKKVSGAVRRGEEKPIAQNRTARRIRKAWERKAHKDAVKALEQGT